MVKKKLLQLPVSIRIAVGTAMKSGAGVASAAGSGFNPHRCWDSDEINPLGLTLAWDGVSIRIAVGTAMKYAIFYIRQLTDGFQSASLLGQR